ncbi:AT-rich interactive domain-containing protein 5B-like [Astyanax mexicanus]|uniref:AT-rich interactive domain-containing protein 5B-like n=1 Tax=Astyanax mexicanus TaxID=7994 RepID=A0A8T2L4Z7_ASTMX|nr:AT-rich interactive domain-containing protein 5B-like [Astyanax mexicanus]
MEQNTIQWVGPPCCRRGTFAFYKSVCHKPEAGAPVKAWTLGEFYYVRCGPQEPICIAEVTLLWEDQKQGHLLASSRLYFLPEDTPKGRTGEHGEDEVLGLARKVIIRVEDLVNWTCLETPLWKGSCQKSNGNHIPDRPLSEPQEVKTEDASPAKEQRVKVLSYPQYCRFRSLQKRTQNQTGSSGLQESHLLALGGLKLALDNTRVMYCRDIFNHPTIGTSPSLIAQFGCTSLSLKGRPRKRKGRDGSVSEQNFSQSDSWGEKMKEHLMGDMEMAWEGCYLPHPEEQLFLDRLFVFMERRGSPISKVPNLGFKKINLFRMYSVVKKLGGYDTVTSRRLWKTVYNELGGSPGSTSAATCTRRHYEKLMLPYERHIKGGNPELSKPKATVTSAAAIKKPVRGKAAQGTTKKNKVTSQAIPPDGVVVVRKRGRPPGKRNTKVLPRGRVGRPPLIAKPSKELVAIKEATMPVFQQIRVSHPPTLIAQILPHHPKVNQQVKIEHGPSAPSSLSAQPQHKLQIGGSLERFSPTKGMCPLGLLKARLDLNGVGGPERTAQDPSIPHQTALLSQTKASSPQTPENFQHQCSGCGLDNISWTAGPKDGQTTRPPLPPLKILPLDIDCSLQLRQLMRTRLNSAHMNSFTKRLSEALAQDLSKSYQPNGHALPVAQDQAIPLNLSKKPTTKRSSDDMEVRDSQHQNCGDLQAKKVKMEPEDDCLALKWNRSLSDAPLVQEEPADLSSPRRVRAVLPSRTSLALAGSAATYIPPNANLVIASGNVFPSSMFSLSVPTLKKENEVIPVDLKLGAAPVWKTELKVTPVCQNCEPKSEQISQSLPYEDSKLQDFKVPSLQGLSSSDLSKPSQSC